MKMRLLMVMIIATLGFAAPASAQLKNLLSSPCSKCGTELRGSHCPRCDKAEAAESARRDAQRRKAEAERKKREEDAARRAREQEAKTRGADPIGTAVNSAKAVHSAISKSGGGIESVKIATTMTKPYPEMSGRVARMFDTHISKKIDALAVPKITPPQGGGGGSAGGSARSGTPAWTSTPARTEQGPTQPRVKWTTASSGKATAKPAPPASSTPTMPMSRSPSQRALTTVLLAPPTSTVSSTSARSPSASSRLVLMPKPRSSSKPSTVVRPVELIALPQLPLPREWKQPEPATVRFRGLPNRPTSSR